MLVSARTSDSARAPTPEAADQTALNSDAARRWGRLAVGLPWLVGIGGLAMSVPVLIWAPLLGGLCLGLVGLQVGLARGWIRRRLAGQTRLVEQAWQDAASKPGVRAPRSMPQGVLLAAFLAVFALLGAVVLYTAALKSREPAAAAEILRSQRQNVRAEQGPNERDLPAQELKKNSP